MNGVFDQITTIENLKEAFQKARKGKTKKQYVIAYEEKIIENLASLQQRIVEKTYSPQPLKTFIIRDPKTRKISKSAFEDRIVHHAICNIIEPTIDKKFIYDSYANRKGKGTLKAIQRFDTFKRKVSKNNTQTCYVLKADIKSYFETVDHIKLQRILRKHIQDQDTHNLIEQILKNHKGKEENKGMPLGNLTSQFFANVYLNELDQYVKHKLKTKYYIRYVDDFVILNHSPKTLRIIQKKIDNFLEKQLSIRLHPHKTRILTLKKGIPFLGFKIFYHHKQVAKKNKRTFQKKLQKQLKQYEHKQIAKEQLIEAVEGWMAYAKHANTYKYRRETLRKLNQQITQKPINIAVTQVKKHENFNQKIESSKQPFTHQKTLQLLKQGKTTQEIARQRNIKEQTVWTHITKLIETHQIKTKQVMQKQKITLIRKHIETPEDTLKTIKERINQNNITYNEIECVRAMLRAKQQKQSLIYHTNWYKSTNCRRKCYHCKEQQNNCRKKFQQLIASSNDLRFTRKEFLEFMHKQVTICTLPNEKQKQFMSWKEFSKIRRK